MTHYTNSIEYRKADDNIEYTYEEFQDYFGIRSSKWTQNRDSSKVIWSWD